MEIYCERVRDLLNPSSANKVRVMKILSVKITYPQTHC